MHQKILDLFSTPEARSTQKGGEKSRKKGLRSGKSPLKEKEILLEMQTSFSSLNCLAMCRGKEIIGMPRDNVKTNQKYETVVKQSLPKPV